MSDSDDQDKTRIQPRQRPKAAPPKSSPITGDSQLVSAPRKPNANKDGYAKTEALREPITQAREEDNSVRPTDLLKGRFVLERVLGAGGMGVVYKAKDLLKVEAKDRDPYVAIKVLGEEFKSHPEAFIALQRESRKTQRIAHPNIVNVHDFDKDGDTVFMTMEFLEGTPLDKLIKKFRGVGMPREEAWQILEGICSALSYAHEQRLIHSDLKPGNIFVTNNGLAKVFDFGIARAVAKAEQGDVTEFEDKTVFDAGNLGALTPAYASLEMLEGDPPDVRDDIYALGCIAYELFTGEHPFKRKNAKEAFRRGYKVERIKSLSKRQWKVIESALALVREDRIGSVSDFWSQLVSTSQSNYKIWLAALAATTVIAVAIAAPWKTPEPQIQQPQMSADEYRKEIESEIRLEKNQQALTELFNTLTFDSRWERSLWKEVQSLQSMLGADDPQTIAAYDKAYSEYLNKINGAFENKQFENAKGWIESAQKYTAHNSELIQLEQQIDSALAEIKKAEEERKKREAQARAEAAAKAAAAKKAQPKVTSNKQFEQAYEKVSEQLACNRLLDMPYFERTLKDLKAADANKYAKAEPTIINELADCLGRITRNFPEEGLKAQKYAQGLFNGHAAFATTAAASDSKDSCKESIAGLGARGRRTRCQDNLPSGIKSPITVVIPSGNGLPVFAIGRYEVSVAEFNQYCLASGECKALSNKNTSQPVTSVDIKQVQSYLAWLSKQTGRNYRLPTHDEWVYAANARGSSLDSNRNCVLNVRGIQKGGTLVQANIGQQNGWGMVNYVGNAREWVTEGNELISKGGSFNTPMEQCTTELTEKSNGKADEETGFRVLRQLQ